MALFFHVKNGFHINPTNTANNWSENKRKKNGTVANNGPNNRNSIAYDK